MKVNSVTAALFAAATSTFAAVVTTDGGVTAVKNHKLTTFFLRDQPEYKWRVARLIPLADAITTSNGTTNELAERDGSVSIHCYNEGRAVNRAAIVSTIDHFCEPYPAAKKSGSRRYVDDFSGITILVWMKMINNCAPWKVDGACRVNFRIPVDQCNTKTENNKQGGEMIDGCAHYRLDPGDKGSNDY
ncbi:hypothetical protein D9613_004016 [Agrocybe pediades]|uniref:Uncharacterized protein n=1 Tax=Agrocybe pediades TaxID=84607 RepID=A0A8H4QJF9_9AGAR|nr:hypothetical protein D9613_004016 [Agrocybe pediades]